MESIKSNELFGNVSATLGEPPQHTAPDHRRCAYYVTSEIQVPSHDSLDGPMVCPHGMPSNGAFYSEDHVNDIRRTTHQFLTAIRAGNHKMSSHTIRLFQDLERLTK